MTRSLRQLASLLVAAAAFSCGSAQAAVVALTEASFGAAKVTFSEVAAGTALNGLTINGFEFAETSAITSVSGGGPGDTNHITQPSALSNGNPAGHVFTVLLPELSMGFGFGYALLAAGDIPDGVVVTLFDGATNVGAMGFTATPDPGFPGGFAGIGSTIAFDRATITFSARAGAYDLDNFNSIVARVPTPGTLALVALALCAGAGAARRRAARAA